MSDVFTQTLRSGQILTVLPEIDFGEAILSTMLLALLAVVVLDLFFVVMQRKR